MLEALDFNHVMYFHLLYLLPSTVWYTSLAMPCIYKDLKKSLSIVSEGIEDNKL